MDHENTQVVQISWAAVALMFAKYRDPHPIVDAVNLVMSHQLPVRLVSSPLVILRTESFSQQDGSWAQEVIEGVFNKTCAISYPNYKLSCTIWMLGKAQKYLEEKGALDLVQSYVSTKH